MREIFLPFHRPSIEEGEIQEVAQVLRSGWLTTGPRVKQFEDGFASYVGAPHAVAVNSGTAALHVALSAIRLKPDDEVLVPTMTFTATAEAVLYFGARPVMVDCRPDTFNLDEQALDERVNARTKAIIPVHMAGHPCEMDTILAIAQKYDLKIIEDAAHTPPAKYNGQKIGAISDITAFSFYANKTLTTGEGGMATTANPDYADRMRMMSLHGISRDAWKRYTSEGSWYYEVAETGFKYNLTDIAAAIGIHQLKKADDLHRSRVDIANRYTEAFSRLDLVRAPVVQPNVQHAWCLYILLLNLEMLNINRSQFIEELKARNIGSSVHFIPLHLHPYYRDTFGHRKGDFPNAEWVYERCISLPFFPDMSDQDVADVIEAVGDIAGKHRR